MNSKTGHPMAISSHLPQNTGKIPIILGGLALLGQSCLAQAVCTCPNPQSIEYLAGKIDNFALPTDAAVPDPATYQYPTKNFDATGINQHVSHRFDNLAPPDTCISGATFEFRAKAGSGSGGAGNDGFYFRASPDGHNQLYGVHFGETISNGTPSLLTSSAVSPTTPVPSSGSAWGNNIPGSPPATGVLFQLDLAALPISNSRTTNIINDLDSNNYLNVIVQDDTVVDYFKLTVDYCQQSEASHPLVDGGNQWIMTTYQDNSPNHTQLIQHSICFDYVGTQGTHEVYHWKSPSLPGWEGWARREGDQVYMHGDYAVNSDIKEQHTALQWELATELGRYTERPSKGWGHCVDWQHNGAKGNTNVFANTRFERAGQCGDVVDIVAQKNAYACKQRIILEQPFPANLEPELVHQFESAEAK